jgi:hypothetical protein
MQIKPPASGSANTDLFNTEAQVTGVFIPETSKERQHRKKREKREELKRRRSIVEYLRSRGNGSIRQAMQRQATQPTVNKPVYNMKLLLNSLSKTFA